MSDGNNDKKISFKEHAASIFGKLKAKIARSFDPELPHVSIFTPKVKKPNFILSVAMTTARLFLVFVLLVVMGGGGALIGVAQAYIETTPTLDLSMIEDQDLNSYIYDKNGALLTEYRGSENRVWAGIDEIPEMLQNAFISIEDSRFRQHNGIDIKRIVGVFIANMTSGSSEGGSTIPQQLIKLTVLTDERSYKRKLQEAYLAMQLEQEYEKDQILEAYLNTIHLGESNYGVKAAAQDYFGKRLSQLSLRECAMLAGITKSPYRYNPRRTFYVKNTPEVTNDRTDKVLQRMYTQGYITEREYEDALRHTVSVVEERKVPQLYQYPHFVEYAVSDVVKFMLRQRNLYDNAANRTLMEKEIRTKGLHIYTTIDPDIQMTVEETVYEWQGYPQLLKSSDSMTTNTNPDGTVDKVVQPQVSAAVVDWRTGEIVAMVGSRTQPTQMKTLNRAAKSAMSVGSSIKPIAIYGPALDRGASPASIYYNIPAPIEGWTSETGYPNNYGGGGFTGATTMRTGIIRSLNVVAARTLLESVGISESLNYLSNLGVDTSKIQPTGSDLALGTGGVTALDMAGAYAAVANKGYYQEPISFTLVKSASGEIIIDARASRETRQVFKPSTSWMLIDMLKDAVKSGTGTRAQISGMEVAGKTGTNSEFRGVSFAGVTPYYASCVWIGQDYNKPLAGNAQGGQYAAPLWQAYMAKLHEGKESIPIISDTPESLGLSRKTVCAISGKLATSNCGGNTVTDWFADSTAPTDPCDMHVGSVLLCRVSGQSAGPYCPSSAQQGSSAVIIPQGHVLYNAPLDIVRQYIPGAVRAAESGHQGGASTVCSIHTEQWYNLCIEAETLLASVSNSYELYGRYMDLSDAMRLQTDYNALKSAISPDSPVSAEQITNALNALYVSSLLIPSSTPPSPSPDPLPTPDPTPEPTPYYPVETSDPDDYPEFTD